MAAYKKAKNKKIPGGKSVVQSEDPDRFYREKPAWCFCSADQKMWDFSMEVFWNEILPKLKFLESQTWGEIFLTAKKQNHSIAVDRLNKVAQDRLAELYVESDSIQSIRITGAHRLYGFTTGRVFNILWFDDNHGNNDTCVCRSRLKHM